MNRIENYRRYIIVTPVKNEILYLPEVFENIINQSIQPLYWICVDDESDDGSYEFLTERAKKIPWIKVIRTGRKLKREIGFHYSEVVMAAFDYIKKNIYSSFDYIGILDADILLPQDYYENLIKKFEHDKSLGIASGIVLCKVKNRIIWEKEPPEWPCGAARLWTKECFEKTGWKISRAPDSVSTASAMRLGYKTRNYEDLAVIHLRPTWSGSGFWYGFIDIGKSRYYLGYDPIFVAFASLKYTLDYPHIGTIPFLIGYLSDFIGNKKRIEDKFVIDFFKKRLISKIRAGLKRIF